MAPKIVLLGAIFISLIASGCAQCSMTKPCADRDELGGGQDFIESEPKQSTSSSWSVELNVEMANINYGWLNIIRRTYNGKIAGPTLVVKQGDMLAVTLNNQLSEDENDIGVPHNEFRYPNSTNLHTHGLHISSKDPQDNVLKYVGPGGKQEYRYEIRKDQPSGTYWYHAHLHGSTMFQVHSGMSGLLIVADNVDEMPQELNAVSCPNNCAKDIQMLFQPILMFKGANGFGKLQNDIKDYEGFKHDSYQLDGSQQTLTDWLEKNVDYYTTNGQLQPDLEMVTGEMYRFRMVNAGGNATLELYITDSVNVPTDKCEIREIAIDGVYLDTPREMHDSQTFLTAASRVDWMVKCNSKGTYKIRSAALSENTPSIGVLKRFTGDLVTLTVTGNAVSPIRNFPSTLPPRPDFVRDLRKLAESQIEGRFVVELNPQKYLNRELWSKPSHYRYAMTVGTAQEWHLLNTDTEIAHPLHIHVNHFQVISYNNYTGGFGYIVDENTWIMRDIDDQTSECKYQGNYTSAKKQSSVEGTVAVNKLGSLNRANTNPLKYWGHDKRFEADNGNTLGYSRLGDWRDVVLVPPLSNITIRFVAHAFTGDLIVHCHILSHEDAGMMMNTKVVAEGKSTDAYVTSAGAYPGTCKACDRYPFNNETRLCDGAAATRIPNTVLFAAVLFAYTTISFDPNGFKQAHRQTRDI